MSTLLLPNGFRYRPTVEISAEDMAWLATAEDVLRKLNLSLICLRCKTTPKGQNAETDATVTVSCECRRLTYRVRDTATP